MNRILIATDGSPASQEAVEFGVELAEEHDSAVVFVHVIQLVDRVPMSGVRDGRSRAARAERERPRSARGG
jgi:nucleotide-binding universal stress UspA family protein